MKLSKRRHFLLAKNAVKRLLPAGFHRPAPVDDSEIVRQTPAVVMDWPDGVRKPKVGLVRDVDPHPYWTKFLSFMEANGIPCEIYDIHRSDWRAHAEDLDMIVWEPVGFPHELAEARLKIHVLEHYMGKICYPSFDEVMLYEDKELQWELLHLHGLPAIDTFVSHSYEETRDHLRRRSYPTVWKLPTASGSFGVELARRRRVAERWARAVFSSAGRRTYWPYVAQKDCVYLQPLEPNEGYDVRVLVIGDCSFGYFRDVPRGEFRASGMNTIRRDRPPDAAVRVARRVAEVLKLPCVAVDFLVDPSGGVKIIELSSFILVRTPHQLIVNGVSGALVGDDMRFVEGDFWPQHLALKQVLRTEWLDREGRP